MTFRDIAVPIASLGVPIIRLRPKSKLPFDDVWQNLATTDIGVIEKWNSETPDANCGSVAKADGFLFFESDEPGVIKRYQEETGESFQTFTAQSRPGRYHFYFKQTDLTRKVGSITQKKLKFGSLRQHNAFVVSPGSLHPDTGLPYTVVRNAPVAPAPDRFIEWLVAQVGEEQKQTVPVAGVKISTGGRNSSLASLAGKLRRDGLEKEEVEAVLQRFNRDNCVPPLPESEVSTIAWSISKKDMGPVGPTLTIGGVEPGTNVYSQVSPGHRELPEVKLIERGVEETPYEYPFWAWNGTLYEEFSNLCGSGNLIPKEFFIEAMKTIVGSICGHRILPEKMPHQEGRFYTILLSATGGIGKSSAVNWAKELFIGTGMLYDIAQDGSGAFVNIGAAQGGFASGSGLITNGLTRHARILQNYDEVTSLIEKFGITGSGDAFLDAVNTLFESGFAPGNVIRASKIKEMPTHPVHNSILGCSTFEKWNSSFVKTNSESSGFFQRLNIISSKSEETVPDLKAPDLTVLRDKFVRKIQPLEFQMIQVNPTPEASKMLKDWHKSKMIEWKDYPSDVRGRIEVMIQRNCSHLAWLLGGDFPPNPDGANEPVVVECDKDIMEKSLALAEYQIAVRYSHQPAIGNNEWALVENLIKKVAKQHTQISRKDLYREIRADKFGIMTFNKAIDNLFQEGIIDLGQEAGNTSRGRKNQVISWVVE